MIWADQRVSFVIDRVQEITHPASEKYKALGIRSLRDTIGAPARVIGHGSIHEASEEDQRRLKSLRSSQFKNTFRKRLAELGVETNLVRHNWFARLSQISMVRTADRVEACYRFLGKDYSIDTDSGFDPESATFWIGRANQGRYSSFFETIAAQLVFETGTRPVDCMALERTLKLEIHDRSFGRPGTLKDLEDEEMDHSDGEDGRDDEQNRELGEVIHGDASFEPDPSRNIPKPSPLPMNAVRTPQSSRSDYSSTGHNRSRRPGARGGAGEGVAHRTLKEYIRDNPLSVGIDLKRAKSETESKLPSGDFIDVFFENSTSWIGVEVKTDQSSEDDIRRGLYQCVKYRAVMEADCSVRGIERNIRVLLALGGLFPRSLLKEKTVLDIEVRDRLEQFTIR